VQVAQQAGLDVAVQQPECLGVPLLRPPHRPTQIGASPSPVSHPRRPSRTGGPSHPHHDGTSRRLMRTKHEISGEVRSRQPGSAVGCGGPFQLNGRATCRCTTVRRRIEVRTGIIKSAYPARREPQRCHIVAVLSATMSHCCGSAAWAADAGVTGVPTGLTGASPGVSVRGEGPVDPIHRGLGSPSPQIGRPGAVRASADVMPVR
jgi:hypothetical protein